MANSDKEPPNTRASEDNAKDVAGGWSAWVKGIGSRAKLLGRAFSSVPRVVFEFLATEKAYFFLLALGTLLASLLTIFFQLRALKIWSYSDHLNSWIPYRGLQSDGWALVATIFYSLCAAMMAVGLLHQYLLRSPESFINGIVKRLLPPEWAKNGAERISDRERQDLLGNFAEGAPTAYFESLPNAAKGLTSTDSLESRGDTGERTGDAVGLIDSDGTILERFLVAYAKRQLAGYAAHRPPSPSGQIASAHEHLEGVGKYIHTHLERSAEWGDSMLPLLSSRMSQHPELYEPLFALQLRVWSLEVTGAAKKQDSGSIFVDSQTLFISWDLTKLEKYALRYQYGNLSEVLLAIGYYSASYEEAEESSEGSHAAPGSPWHLRPAFIRPGQQNRRQRALNVFRQVYLNDTDVDKFFKLNTPHHIISNRSDLCALCKAFFQFVIPYTFLGGIDGDTDQSKQYADTNSHYRIRLINSLGCTPYNGNFDAAVFLGNTTTDGNFPTISCTEFGDEDISVRAIQTNHELWTEEGESLDELYISDKKPAADDEDLCSRRNKQGVALLDKMIADGINRDVTKQFQACLLAYLRAARDEPGMPHADWRSFPQGIEQDLEAIARWKDYVDSVDSYERACKNNPRFFETFTAQEIEKNDAH